MPGKSAVLLGKFAVPLDFTLPSNPPTRCPLLVDDLASDLTEDREAKTSFSPPPQQNLLQFLSLHHLNGSLLARFTLSPMLPQPVPFIALTTVYE